MEGVYQEGGSVLLEEECKSDAMVRDRLHGTRIDLEEFPYQEAGSWTSHDGGQWRNFKEVLSN